MHVKYSKLVAKLHINPQKIFVFYYAWGEYVLCFQIQHLTCFKKKLCISS